MNIGMVVYSRTGNTLSVAKKLKERLSAAGHTVTLQRLEAVGPISLGPSSPELKTVPAIGEYEAVVLGSSVQGGVLPPIMMSYLQKVTSFEGKKVACLVTGFFPSAGWGRNQTVAQIVEICESKGTTVCGSGSVGWFSLRRGQQISKVVDDLSALF